LAKFQQLLMLKQQLGLQLHSHQLHIFRPKDRKSQLLGIENCKMSTEIATFGRSKIKLANIAAVIPKKILHKLIKNDFFTSVIFNLATATPNVNNIIGIAICPINSKELVKKSGVSQPCHIKIRPRIVPITDGSLSICIGEPTPATTQIPIVKATILVNANTIIA